jgi:hypothetical protein
MKDSELTRILGNCLDQIAAGKTVAACLAQYPEHAAELAPLLAMAGELGTLRDYRLSEAARQRAHARLLRAEIARNNQRATRWWQPGSFAVSRLAAGLAVVLFCVALTTGMVAASQPGDLAYGVRVVVERAPAWLAREPETRARAELGIAARRLADLDRTMSSQQQDLDPRTVAALLASAERASALAASLPESEQTEISVRLAEQARRLAQLGQISRSAQNAAALRAAAERTQRAAENAQPPTSSDVHPARPAAGPTETPGQGDHRTPAAERTPTPGPHATRQSTSRPAHTATPLGPDPSATAPHLGPSVTPPGPRPSATPQGPGPNATAPGPGPSATPQGPGPNATAPGPGPTATPQGPGPDTTPQGPGPDATPQGSGPDATPQGPGPGEPGGTGQPGEPGEPGGPGQ